MYMFNYILATTLNFLLMFFMNRGMLWLYLYSILRKRERKRLAKNQSFKEWFFYKRYTDIIPKIRLVCYYANFALYPLSIIAVIVGQITGIQEIGTTALHLYFQLEAIPLVIQYIMLR